MQIGQGTVTGEGKIGAASRHGAVLAVCLENPGDNDTSAGEHGSRSGVRGMLQRERVL